ncbi:AAA family ATPase [Arthrobacter sp. Soil763]|uniref:AAA family ATPase n=1 Tax=Arthrobacter sp. Soil763 TaxID=1736402 RepID=UPI0006FA7433|nr:SMC family ATPase [Arthrobacter sp. Soil763]KRE80069.1 chromosome segregation protein SMC [Arthrobacter sp. Soil763]
MRIHRLEITAFGPFAGTERIDFDRLSAHGLFLLNGATGAGKTSVLDAICFALYGSVPGARQEGKRLRSDHADAATEPRVTCEFSAQGRHFEVSRTPAWNKPSARGKNGFTEQKANTLLRERVDGQWLEKSGRNDEAGAEITALLGMDRDQFTRVVMLPQGDFAAFLRSKASDRLVLLQSLFGTQRFEAVEQELGRRAAAARAEVETLNGRLGLLLAQAEAETAGLGLDLDAAPGRDDADALLAWLATGAQAAAAERQVAAAEAEQHAAGLARRLEDLAARAARQAKLAAAHQRRADAEAAAPELEAKAVRLQRHRKAEVLGGQLQALDSAEAAAERAAAAAAGAAAELRAAALTDPELAALPMTPGGSGPDAGLVDGTALRGELARLRSLRAVLEERLPDEEKLSALTARAAALRSGVATLQEARRAGTAALEALRSESHALAAALGPLEELAAEAQLRAKEAAAAEELVAVVDRHAAAAANCARITERHRAARDTFQDRRQHWLDLREERLANAAAELAAQLRPDEPCPVCGSAEHPAPAQAAASALAIADAEQAAQEAADAAEAELSDLERVLREAQQNLAVLAAQGGDTDPDAARSDADRAQERAAEAARAAADLDSNRARRTALEEEITAAGQERAAAGEQLAQAESSLTEVTGQAEGLEAALAGLRAGHESLAARLGSVRGATALLERADAAAGSLEQARERTAEARTRLELALPEAGFESAAAARAVLLPAPEAAQLEAAVRSGRDEAARLEELFASEDLALAARELADGGAVDEAGLDQLRTESAGADRSVREAVLAAGLATKSVLALDRISAEYAGQAAAGREPRERAELWTAVAESARGGGENNYRMSLNSYVLAARLEQVAAAATERLIGMSDGRYTLQHTDARAARNQKSGLGLEVVDQWTGQRRDTATLSGGESFMASLALALGLADVVQMESGGVDIETLFVDEGFGSLDEQSLEQVMDALEGLRDGGRVVGLVSHVAEMKQRITTQLQVVKGRNGSTLHISDGIPA